MTPAQIKFGLALADDVRRLRNNNVLPGGLIPLNTSVEALVKFQMRLGLSLIGEEMIASKHVADYEPADAGDRKQNS